MLTKKNIDRKIDCVYRVVVSQAERDGNNWSALVSTTISDEVSYQDNAAAAGTAFFYNYREFRSLQQTYSGFKWVSTTDVLNFLKPYGIDVAYDEIFCPLMLKYVESGQEKSYGPLHKTTNSYRQTTTPLNGTFDPNRIEGTWARRQTVMHPNVSMVAFCPTTDPVLAKWKCGLIGGRLARDIKFWDNHKPVFQAIHAAVSLGPFGSFIGENDTGETRNVSVDPDPIPDVAWLAEQNQGPFFHVEFGPAAGEDNAAAHELWLKMNYRMLIPIAVRMATNAAAADITADPNIVMVHQDFWAAEADGWTAHYLINELFNETLYF